MEKWATEQGCAKYFSWHPIHNDQKRLFDSLFISSMGCGTYLGAPDDATDHLYEQTLMTAATSGINLFDTAIHYRCMRSEKVLGKVMQALAYQGIERKQMVISTKGGYLPCEGSPEEFDDYVRMNYLDTKLITPQEIAEGCHSISIPFLENQIQTSLKNMQLSCIDLYYLHNPEIQLQEMEEETFYQKLTDIFRLFEKKVSESKIKRYGIATWNGFRKKSIQKTALNLSRILSCAKEAGGEKHHFRAVQIPFNLVMMEILKKRSYKESEEKKSLIQRLLEENISLMVASPLMQSHVMQLPSRIFSKLPSETSHALQALQFVSSTPGVCSFFVGMKDPKHLKENLQHLQNDNWNSEEFAQATSTIGL